MYKRIKHETGFSEGISGRRFRCTTLTDLYEPGEGFDTDSEGGRAHKYGNDVPHNG